MIKKTVAVLGLCVFGSGVHAASEQLIWGASSKAKPQKAMNFMAQPKTYQLKRVDNSLGKNERHQVMYQGVPVWGYQLIKHHLKSHRSVMTGINISGIERDINSVTPKLSSEEAQKLILKKVSGHVNYQALDKIIYLDKDKKAHLAYHAAFYVRSSNNKISAPNFIIDANTGDVLKQWNNLHQDKVGQGLGGSMFSPVYRPGLFQYGGTNPTVPALGKFEVKIKKGKCIFESPVVRVVDIRERDPESFIIPVFRPLERLLKLKPYKYACDKNSGYVHNMDDESGPMNYSYSSLNDTMYFASKTMEMFQKAYGVARPIGKDLPLRAYTHLQDMDNAFAIPTLRIKKVIVSHQQVFIGNGQFLLTPSAQSIFAHELSHLVTDAHAKLVYEGQSGGLNESFSDMAAFALQDYIRQDFPWYWDGKTWTLGTESTIGSVPIRYMDDPTLDGESIDNAKNYYEEMDPHNSSGVFNKAFYLLSQKPDWSVHKAFQVMLDANMNYWMPNTSFEAAACGVIQATLDRQWDKTVVESAFDEVGVHCPLVLTQAFPQ